MDDYDETKGWWSGFAYWFIAGLNLGESIVENQFFLSLFFFS